MQWRAIDQILVINIRSRARTGQLVKDNVTGWSVMSGVWGVIDTSVRQHSFHLYIYYLNGLFNTNVYIKNVQLPNISIDHQLKQH